MLDEEQHQVYDRGGVDGVEGEWHDVVGLWQGDEQRLDVRGEQALSGGHRELVAVQSKEQLGGSLRHVGLIVPVEEEVTEVADEAVAPRVLRRVHEGVRGPHAVEEGALGFPDGPRVDPARYLRPLELDEGVERHRCEERLTPSFWQHCQDRGRVAADVRDHKEEALFLQREGRVAVHVGRGHDCTRWTDGGGSTKERRKRRRSGRKVRTATVNLFRSQAFAVTLSEQCHVYHRASTDVPPHTLYTATATALHRV